MSITRHFLDWKEPALPAAADYLLARYRRDQRLDMRRAIVVIPGGRAGRRLLEILVERSELGKLLLTPPEVTTEGRLPELLYSPKRPFASDLAQELAWSAALRNTSASQLRHVVPHPPGAADISGWLELGKLLGRLHKELAADGLNFSHVADQEQERWRALREVQQEYLRQLDELNLWDIQTARLVAIEKREFQTDKDIILLGTVDLNRAMRQILNQVASQVTALIHAPESLADRFDEHGCLIPAAWRSAEIPIRDDQIQRVDGPAEQADAVTRFVGALGGKYRADEIVVSVPDESLVPQLQRQLEQCGISSRWVEGKRLAETGPYRLLEAAAQYAADHRFTDLAALARHPDVEAWLLPQLQDSLEVQRQQKHRDRQAGDIETALDLFYNEQFPARVDSARLDGCRDRWPVVHKIVQLASAWLQPLSAPSQKLSAWSDALRQVLLAIYGGKELNRSEPNDRYLLAVCERLETGLQSLTTIPPDLEPSVDLRAAIHMLLAPLRGEAIPPPPAPDAVELLGWLELALDDAPVLTVTSVNEGFIPQSTTSDAFLPNGLRQRLGLLHNDRRYARDAYALSVLLASRKELTLIVGHRDADNNPLIPSRLLFAADEVTITSRALRLFEKLEETPSRRTLLATGKGPLSCSAFVIPRPQPHQRKLEYISVSQFKAYLACRYRFYLGHILQLSALADRASELDPGAFGSLIHDVLQIFGRRGTQQRTSTKPQDIFDFLREELERLAAGRFGGEASRSAIRMQIEQARQRLGEFAKWQARQNDEGWEIVYSEETEKQLCMNWAVGESQVVIRGRIDRIDYHADRKQFRVLDYKTADNAQTPEQTHRKREEWIDLQLPLYRGLVRAVQLENGLKIDGDIQLGYVNLPRDLGKIGHEMAAWTPDELSSADEKAREVVRGIMAQRFHPPTEPPPSFSEEFAAICQDNVLGRRRFILEEDQG